MKSVHFLKGLKQRKEYRLAILLLSSMIITIVSILGLSFWGTENVYATNYLSNPSFTGGTTDWTLTTSMAYDSATYQDSAGSLTTDAGVGRNNTTTGEATQSISTQIGADDTVLLNFYWMKSCISSTCSNNQIDITVTPQGGTATTIWTNSDLTNLGTWQQVSNVDVSSYFTTTTTYSIQVYMYVRNANDKNAQSIAWVDNMNLDVTPAATPEITVGSSGSQTASVLPNTSDFHTGGAFTFVRDSSSTSVTSITMSNTGTVSDANISGLSLYYKQEATCSSTIPGDATLFNSTAGTFTSGSSTVTGSMTVGTSQVCLYAQLDVGSATSGNTILMEISDPSTEVTASDGTVAPSTAVAISGTTTIATPNITTSSTGTQITSVYPNTNDFHTGGAFTLVRDSGSTSVTSITISNTGTVSDSNISGLSLYYKQEATCSTSIPGDATLFNSTPGTFTSGSSTVTGSMTVGTSQVCLYAQLDVGAATPDETILIQITNPSTQITASDGTVSPSTAIAISGTTTIATPNITTSSTGTQITSVYPSTNDFHVGGAFTLVRDSGSTSVTSITVSNTGTVSDANISGLSLYYKQEATCSTSIPGDATLFNSTPGSFTSGSSTVTGSMTVGTSQVCLYVQLDVGTATPDETILIQITNPSTQITASEGSVSPSTPVAISGTTTIAAPPNITVGTEGSQTASVYPNTSNFHTGGAFTLVRNTTSTSVTSITISNTGTISDANISGLSLYYKQEATCSNTIPGDATLFNSTPGTFTSGSSTVTGDITVGTSQICLYAQLDIGSASIGDTLLIEVTDPSTEITASEGSISPSTPVAISGTTTVAAVPNITVGTEGSQTADVFANTSDFHTGGSFTLVRDSGSTSVTSISISNTGTISDANISGLSLYYKQEATCSSTIPGDATLFNSTPGTFTSGSSTVTGTMTVGTSQICLYAQLDVDSASPGNTLLVQITNPSTQVIASDGTVSPSTAVAINGTTTIATPNITFGAEGSQTAEVYPNTSDFHTGGAFTLIRDNSSTSVTSITVSNTGTISDANISGLSLYYKAEATCSATIPGDATLFNSTPGTFASGSSTVTGSMTVGTSQICLYAQLDVGSASPNDTILIQVTNPSTQVIASDGTVSPSTPITISGTTTVIAYPNITVGTEGSQTTEGYPDTTDFHTGGAFTLIRDSGSTSVTSITLSNTGTISDTNISGLSLYYKTEATCSSTIPGDATLFNSTPGTFASGSSTVTGTMTVGTSQICLYAQLDVGSANPNDTILVQVTNPSTQVIASDGTVSPSSAVAISGTTTVIAYPNITVGTEGSQTADVFANTNDFHTGGAFTLIRDSGSTSVTSISISNTGTISDANISGLSLYYKTEATCSTTIPGDATLFNSTPGTFTSGNSTVTGNMTVGTSQICLYTQLDIGSASPGDTLLVQITNPSTQVTASDGTVSPSTAVAISGTTTIAAPNITTSSTGTQITNVYPNTTDFHVGGSFALIRDSGSTSVTSVTVSNTGTISDANISGLSLYYKQEATCSTSIPGDATLFNSTAGTFTSGSSTVTGSMTVGTSQVCLYAQVDIGSANPNDTILIEITNPSTQITASDGTVSPSTPITISGTTTVIAYPNITVGTEGSQTAEVYPNTNDFHTGGAFTLIRDSASTSVTSITVSNTGTISDANISGLSIYYKQEATCSSTIPGDATLFNSTPGSFTSGSSTVTGSMTVGTSKICLYAEVDVGSASPNDTILVQITDPSTEVTASFGTISPSSPVAINGTTTVIAYPNITVGTEGSQTAEVFANTNDFHTGGAFTLVRDSGSTSVTSITVSNTGTISDANISGLSLYYKAEATCSTTIPGDATLFNSTPGTFTSGSSTVTGSMSVGTSQVCLYAQLDIGSASPGDTLLVEVTDPSTEVTASDGTVSPSTPVVISGTTTIATPNITVASSGSQTAEVYPNTTDFHTGGAFTLIRDNSSTSVTSITVSNTGTISDANISGLSLYYKAEATCSSTVPGDATLFNSTPGSFTSESSTVTGTMTVGTSQVCLYAQLDVGAANPDDTILLQITNPSTQITASDGTVSPSTAVAISGTTTVIAYPNITVGTEGSQTAEVFADTSDFHTGGAFTLIRNTSSTSVTSITVSNTGTISDANISGLSLYYKQEATCSATIPGDATLFNSTPGTFTSGSSTVTGTMSVGTSQVCLYAQLDIGSASSGDTLLVEITDPSTEVTASDGNVSPSTPVAITGTTTISDSPNITVGSSGTQTAEVYPSTNDFHTGGAFTLLRNTSSASVTSITISNTGTISDTNISGLSLYYKQEATCSSTIPGDATLFNSTPGTFTSGSSTVTGSMSVGTSQICLYAEIDVGSASPSDTILMQITNPSTQITASDGTVSPSTPVTISGTTTVIAYPNITVATEGSQTAEVFANTSDFHTGGAFNLVRDSESTSVTSITVSNTGTISDANISGLSLYYKQEATCSTTIPGDATLFNSTAGTFTSGSSTVTGDMTVGTSKICLYAQLDIGSASPGDTLLVQITNPSTQVVASDGTVSPSSAVAISGTTTIATPNITTTSTGTQITNVYPDTSDFHVGGSFALVRDSGSTSVTSITISDTGTISDANISGLSLYYKQEATCSATIPGDATLFNSTAGTFTSGSSTVTGSMTVGTSQVCLYVQLDVGSASPNDTILIQITNPSTQITASDGTVSPSTPVTISGTTTVIAYPNITVETEGSQTAEVFANTSDFHTGGAFTLVRDSGSTSVTSITVSNTGTISDANISGLSLYYKQEPTCSTTIPGDATLFNSTPGTFTSGSSTVTGSMSVGTSQVCLYAQLDIGSASTGDTLLVQISDPSTEVTASAGTVSPATPVAISGTTTVADSPNITMGSSGSQTTEVFANTTDFHTGGAFTLVRNTSSTSVTSITVSNTGTISDANISGLSLYYKQEATCSSTIPGDATLFNATPGTFTSGSSTVTGTMTVGTSQVCLYAQVDVGSASPGDTLLVQITDPSTQVTASDGTVSPSTPVAISGTTTIATPNITTSSTGTQTTSVYPSTNDFHTGGAFALVRDSGSTSVTNITISETGTISDANISGLSLYYKQEAVCSGTIPGDATLFNSTPGTFTSGSSTVTGTMTVGTSQVCLYAQVDVGSANPNDTILIEITNPSTQITASEGTVSPSSAVNISGTTTVIAYPNITVATEGSQTTGVLANTNDFHIGGAFSLIRDTGSTSVTSITISETGTISDANISGLSLYYKQEATCSSTIPVDATLFNSTPGTFTSGSSTVTGSITVGTSKICLYVELDIGSASPDDTILIEITDPSTEVTASNGTVSPSTPVAISGTTTVTADPNITVGTSGSQTADVFANTNDFHTGGAFTLVRDSGSTSVTSITISDTGTISDANISGLSLYYKQEATCSSTIPGDATLFNSTPGTFTSGSSTVTGNMSVGTSQICLYAQLDIGSASPGDTLLVQITNPSTQVTASDGTVSPSSPVAISGTTTIATPNITVGTEGSQTSSVYPSTNDFHTGGAFTLVRDNSSTSVTSITVSNTGTISDANISGLSLYYKQEATCSATIPGDATLFNSTPGTFTSGSSTVTGNMTVGTSQICLYAELDVGSASPNDTILIQISNPSTQVTASDGTVSPSTAVAISGTTTVTAYPNITVSSSGSQTAEVYTNTNDFHTGGAFTLVRDSGSTSVTSITISNTGTVSDANISGLSLYYKQETTCSSTIPGDATLFNSTPGAFTSGSSTVIGSMTVGTSQICLYAELDIGSANTNDTIQIQITNPSTEITASDGTVSPSSAVSISGTTTIQEPISPEITVGSSGAQTGNVYDNTSDFYIGGAFTFIRNTESTSVTSITISNTGTISDANISNLSLYYKQQATCSSSIPIDATLFNSTPGTFTSGSSTVTGTMTVGTSQVCTYLRVDIGSATDGDTILIQITDPSTKE